MGSLETYLSSPGGVAMLAATLFLLLMANACHEGAHALVAFLEGDRRASILRRVSLHPLRHFSFFLTLVLPLLSLWLFQGQGILGGAKPVMVRRDLVGRFGMARVAFAGPLANFLFAGFLLVFLSLSIHFEVFGLTTADWLRSPLWRVMYFPLWFAVALGLVNLLPLPGLDGGHMVASLLPERAREIWYRFTPLGIVLLLALFLWQGGFLAELGIGPRPSGPNVFAVIESRVHDGVEFLVRQWSERL